MTENEENQRLKTPAAAKYIGVNENTLRKWRQGRIEGAPRIPYTQATPRSPVYYDKADLDKFLAKSRRDDSE